MSTLEKVLLKNRIDPKGEAPIAICIITDGKPTYLQTVERVPPDLWDEQRQAVSSGHPNAKLINARIDKMVSDMKSELLKEQIDVKLIGEIYAWTFAGGSLEADQVTQSPGVTINSQTYTNNTSFAIDVAADADKGMYMRLGAGGVHTMEYGEETVEFTLNRRGTGTSYVGCGYYGETLLRPQWHIFGMDLVANTAIIRDTSIWPNTSYFTNISVALTAIPAEGNKYRIDHRFQGYIQEVFICDITSTVTQIGYVSQTYANGYQTRPNNRSFCLFVKDVGVTITMYSASNMESCRARLLLLGDSITATRIASTYDRGYSRLATKFYGVGSFIHAGGSNLVVDLINAIQDTLIQRPEIVVVAIGTNECNNGTPTRFTDFQNLITQLESVQPRPCVIISNVIPAENAAYPTGTDSRFQRILDYNAWLQTNYGSTHTIVDQFAVLANATHDNWNPIYRADALHPNDAGMLAMFNELKKYL